MGPSWLVLGVAALCVATSGVVFSSEVADLSAQDIVAPKESLFLPPPWRTSSLHRRLVNAKLGEGRVSRKDFMVIADLVHKEVAKRKGGCESPQQSRARGGKKSKRTGAESPRDACGCKPGYGWSRQGRRKGCSPTSMNPKCGCVKGEKTDKMESNACINDGGCGAAGGTWLRDMLGDLRGKFQWLVVFQAIMKLGNTLGGIMCPGHVNQKTKLGYFCCEKILDFNYARWNTRKDTRYGGKWRWQDYTLQPKGRPKNSLNELLRNHKRTCRNWDKYRPTVVNEEADELGEADLTQAQWGAAKKLFKKAKSVYKKVKKSVKKHVKKGLAWAKSALLGKLLKLIPSQYAWMRPIVKKFLEGKTAAGISMIVNSKAAISFVRNKIVRPIFRKRTAPTERMDCLCWNTIQAGVSAAFTSTVDVCDRAPDCKSQGRKFCSLDGGKHCNNPGADKEGYSAEFKKKLKQNPALNGYKLWEDKDYYQSTRSTVAQRRVGLDTDLDKATLLERNYGPLTYFLHKSIHGTKTIVCGMKMSIDFQLCSKVENPSSTKPYWYTGKELICNAQMVKKPLTSTLTYDSKKDGAQCKEWFTIMDGQMRAFVSIASASHAARRTYPCRKDAKKKRKTGTQLGEAGNFEPDNWMGEGGGKGRRGGSMMSASTFTLGTMSNRAGNSESMW